MNSESWPAGDSKNCTNTVVIDPMVALLSADSKEDAVPSVKKNVEARAGWQGVGVVLSGGERLSIKASGTWVFNPGQPACDANGARNLPTKGRGEYPLHDVSGFEGQLLARVYKSGQALQGPFAVGTNASIAVGAGGELQFSINDAIVGSGAGLTDNSGALAVEIDY